MASDGLMHNNQYYVRDRTTVQGPFDLNELARRVKTRRLARHHQVSVDRVEWRRASDALPELFQSSAPTLRRPKSYIEPLNLDDDDHLSQGSNQPVGMYRGSASDTASIRQTNEYSPMPVARPRNWTSFANFALLSLAILAPLVVIGGLAMLVASGSPSDASIARNVGPCLATVQGIHPRNGKKECYAILVSRNQLVAPIVAATLEGLKVETQHTDGHTEWHSAHLLTADPVTGLCVLRAECGRDVTFMKLPESRALPERRAPLKLLLPDPDGDQQIERATLVKVLNEGEPDESLQVEFDDRVDALEDPLGRVVVDVRGVLVGLVVGRLPDSTSLCTPAYEIRSKKKEAGKFPADHVLKRIDLPDPPVPGLPPHGDEPLGTSAAPGMERPQETDQPSESGAPTRAARDESSVEKQQGTSVDLGKPNAGDHPEGEDTPQEPSPGEEPLSTPEGGEQRRSTRRKPMSPGGVADAVRGAVDAAIPLPPLPPETARELGDKLREDVCSKHRVTGDQAWKTAVRLMVNSVLIAADKKPEDYTVTVVEDDTVQASAFVGNNIVVHTGLIEFAGRDDDMMRFILAHEIGHLVLGHVEMPFRRELLAGRLVPGATQVSGTLNSVLKNSPYNQAQEEEADCFAVDLHRNKNWSVEGGVRFFRRIRDEELPSGEDGMATSMVDEMFSSHPDHERRIELLTNGCGP